MNNLPHSLIKVKSHHSSNSVDQFYEESPYDVDSPTPDDTILASKTFIFIPDIWCIFFLFCFHKLLPLKFQWIIKTKFYYFCSNIYWLQVSEILCSYDFRLKEVTPSNHVSTAQGRGEKYITSTLLCLDPECISLQCITH